MNENPNCADCCLASRVQSVCLPSIGDKNCKLAIFLDHPSTLDDRRGRSWVSDNARFVLYCLERMSVSVEEVFLDYIVKCCPGKMPGKKADRMACVNACSQYRYAALKQLTKLKAMVVLGALGSEAMTQEQHVGQRAGVEWTPTGLFMKRYVDHVWVGLSPGVLKEKPSEAGAIYRVIFMAAEEAGLSPHVAKIAPFDFQIL